MLLASPVLEKTLSLVSVPDRCLLNGAAVCLPAVDVLAEDLVGEEGLASSAKGDIVRDAEPRVGEVNEELLGSGGG